MKIFRSTDAPSWPDLLADGPLKVGTNTLADLMKRGRIRCRIHGLPAYWGDISWIELTRLANLHRELLGHLADRTLSSGKRARRKKHDKTVY